MSYLVTGAGPVGATVAEQLAARGEQVRLATRSGSGPQHQLIERIRLDVNDRAGLRAAAQGATAIFHCVHGSKYEAAAWRAELPGAERTVMDVAAEVGAVVVFPESLYSYGRVSGPMTEATPSSATTGKLGVRADLIRARAEHAAHTVSMVASDFYGPRVRKALAGERMIPRLLAGQSVQTLGRLDVVHSFTYVPDLAAAMIAAATEPEAWDRVLHAPTAPALTQRELIRAFADAAGVPVPRIITVPIWALRALGAVSGQMREAAETGYMLERPFVMTASVTEELLDLRPTPLAEGIRATLAYWRSCEQVGGAVGGADYVA